MIYTLPDGTLVKVTNTSEDKHRGKLAWVRALSGRPFTKFSHGGPMQSDWTVVPFVSLKEVTLDDMTPEQQRVWFADTKMVEV